mgnify:CR=1 FL=1
MNQSPQELLSHLTGLLETTQQQSAQTRATNETLTQSLIGAVQELTQAVRALTAAVDVLTPPRAPLPIHTPNLWSPTPSPTIEIGR